MTPPTWPVAPKIPIAHAVRLRVLARPRRSERRTAVSCSDVEGVVRGPDGLLLPAITQLMRMAEVEIISMLMPLAGQRLEHRGGDAGVRLHAGADEAHPGDAGVGR